MGRTLTLLLLLLEGIFAAAAVRPSSSSRCTYSGLLVSRASTLKNSRRKSRSSAHLGLSSARAPATGGFTKFFACAFSNSACTPVAAPTSTSKGQQQQRKLLHARIYSCSLSSSSTAATPRQRRRTLLSPACTFTDVPVIDEILARSTSLGLLPLDDCLQWQFLRVNPPLLRQCAAIGAPSARPRGTNGVTTRAAIRTSGSSSLLAATPEPQTSLTGFSAPKGRSNTFPHRCGDACPAVTVIDFCGLAGLAAISCLTSKARSVVNVPLLAVYKTRYVTRQSPVARQLLKQPKGQFYSRAPPASQSRAFPLGTLTLSGRIIAAGDERIRTLRDSVSFVGSVRPRKFASESHSINTCPGFDAFLPTCGRGACSRNGKYRTFLGGSVSQANQCGPASIGSATICNASRNSSSISKHQPWRTRDRNDTKTSRAGSTVNSTGCSIESSGSVGSYICLTSPEAARVFSGCWRRAGCPALLPEMLVCIGEGTRAAAEKSLLMEFQLYVRQLQHPLKDRGPQQFCQTHQEQPQDDQQKRHHVLSGGKGEEVDQAQPQPPSTDIANHLPLLRRRDFAEDCAGHSLLPGSSTVSTSPISTGATRGPAFDRFFEPTSCAQPVSPAVPIHTEVDLPPEVLLAHSRFTEYNGVTRDISLDADTRQEEKAGANDARADADRRASGGIEEVAGLKGRCDHKASIAARPDARVQVNDSVALQLHQSFLSLKPLSASAASLAAELPPRPPLLHYLQATVCALLGQHGARKQPEARTAEKGFSVSETQHVLKCINTAIECRSEHARPGCTYTPEEAVACAVKVLHQDESRQLKHVLLQRCCPCWLQTRALWPASALARPTLQDVLQQRPLQDLQRYSFAADVVPVRLQFDVLSVEQNRESHASENDAMRKPGHVGASERSRTAEVESHLLTTETPLEKKGPSAVASLPAAKDDGDSGHEVMPKNAAGPLPAQDIDIPAPHRLFAVERYNTYTTTPVMLTATERRAVLQCMQEILCCSEGRSSSERSNHTLSKQNRSDNDHTTGSADTLTGVEGSRRTSGVLDRSGCSVEITKGTFDSDVSHDLTAGVCDADAFCGDASPSHVNTVICTSSRLEPTEITRKDDTNCDTDGDVRGDGGRGEPRQSSKDKTQVHNSSKKVRPGICLVIVVLASPSAVWGWTANGLPTSAAACCTERPSPSYTAVHADTEGERRLSQCQPARMLMQQPCSVDADSDASSCKKAGGRRGESIVSKTGYDMRSQHGASGGKTVTVAPNADIPPSSKTDASGTASAQLNDGKNSRPANSRDVGGKSARTRAKRRKEWDAAFLEKREFVRLLQSCHQFFQEKRKQREQEQQDGRRRHLVALCIGPTTASAAKQAGFGKTLSGEDGSVAALADLVEAYVIRHCSPHCDASESRASNGHDRVESNGSERNQTEEGDIGDGGSRSCSTSEEDTEEADLHRRERLLWPETKSSVPGKDECRGKGGHSGGNNTAEGSRVGKSKADRSTANATQDSKQEQRMPGTGEQRREACDRKSRVLVLLTRAEDGNDVLMQELLQRTDLQIHAVDLKHLIRKNAQHRSYQHVIETHEHIEAPGEQKGKQQKSGTPKIRSAGSETATTHLFVEDCDTLLPLSEATYGIDNPQNGDVSGRRENMKRFSSSQCSHVQLAAVTEEQSLSRSHPLPVDINAQSTHSCAIGT